MWHAWKRGKMHTKFLSKHKGRKKFHELGVDGKRISEFILEKQGGNLWTGLI
jgi:hypothetical protein